MKQSFQHTTAFFRIAQKQRASNASSFCFKSRAAGVNVVDCAPFFHRRANEVSASCTIFLLGNAPCSSYQSNASRKAAKARSSRPPAVRGVCGRRGVRRVGVCFLVPLPGASVGILLDAGVDPDTSGATCRLVVILWRTRFFSRGGVPHRAALCAAAPPDFIRCSSVHCSLSGLSTSLNLSRSASSFVARGGPVCLPAVERSLTTYTSR